MCFGLLKQSETQFVVLFLNNKEAIMYVVKKLSLPFKLGESSGSESESLIPLSSRETPIEERSTQQRRFELRLFISQ